MELAISKDSEVPLRQQLYAQLMLLIGTRKLVPGDALPSVRALARRLNIHHNTVSEAYQDLVASGLVARRRGARLVVREPETPTAQNGYKDLDDLINDTVLAARQQGYTLAQLRERVRQRLLDAAPERILVLSTDPSFLEIMRAELEESLDWPVEGRSPAEIAADPSLPAGALLLCPPGLMPEVLSTIPKNLPAVPILYSDARQHLESVRSFKRPSLIAVVSISRDFLDLATAVLAPVAAGRHSVREFLMANRGDCDLGAADIAFCDCIAYRTLRSRTGVVPYRVLSHRCIEQIRSMMADLNL